jgi:hypothetical protein
MKLSRAYRIWLAIPTAILIGCASAFAFVPSKSVGGLLLGCTCFIAALASSVVAPTAAVTVLESRELRNWPNWCWIIIGVIPALFLVALVALGLSNAGSEAFRLGG